MVKIFKFLIVCQIILLGISCSGNKKTRIIDKKDSTWVGKKKDSIKIKLDKPDTIVTTTLKNKVEIEDSNSIKWVENTTDKSTLKKLLGKHIFGIQFIYNSWGNATVTLNKGDLTIIGRQYSKDKKEYAKIDGVIKIVDDRTLLFDGRIRLFTQGCCGIIDTTGKFKFYKSGVRKYYRLQDFDKLCSQYTCAYYLDIFDR